jgi:hypothetical protein
MSFLDLITECQVLLNLFRDLPPSLPESSPDSKLPPSIDVKFATEEGPWAAYNKAMHAAFGDKAMGIKLYERGSALLKTIEVTKWCLSELSSKNQKDEMMLVGLWLEALKETAKEARASGTIFPLFKTKHI